MYRAPYGANKEENIVQENPGRSIRAKFESGYSLLKGKMWIGKCILPPDCFKDGLCNWPLAWFDSDHKGVNTHLSCLRNGYCDIVDWGIGASPVSTDPCLTFPASSAPLQSHPEIVTALTKMYPMQLQVLKCGLICSYHWLIISFKSINLFSILIASPLQWCIHWWPIGQLVIFISNKATY